MALRYMKELHSEKKELLEVGESLRDKTDYFHDTVNKKDLSPEKINLLQEEWRRHVEDVKEHNEDVGAFNKKIKLSAFLEKTTSKLLLDKFAEKTGFSEKILKEGVGKKRIEFARMIFESAKASGEKGQKWIDIIDKIQSGEQLGDDLQEFFLDKLKDIESTFPSELSKRAEKNKYLKQSLGLATLSSLALHNLRSDGIETGADVGAHCALHLLEKAPHLLELSPLAIPFSVVIALAHPVFGIMNAKSSKKAIESILGEKVTELREIMSKIKEQNREIFEKKSETPDLPEVKPINMGKIEVIMKLTNALASSSP